jgi:hypothetical protein
MLAVQRVFWKVRVGASLLLGGPWMGVFHELSAAETVPIISERSQSEPRQDQLRLATRLARARPGDWALLQVQDQAVAWRIDHEGNARILEEWAVPGELLQAWGVQSNHWATWIAQDGPGAQARAVYRWHQQSGWNVWEPSQAIWQPLGEEGTLLKSLFELPLSGVQPCHQRRCGPRPKAGVPDERPTWRPVAGRNLPHVEVWTGSLQSSDENGSSARVTLWTAPESVSEFPSFFPLHAEFERVGVRFSCRLLAAGRSLPALDLSTTTPPQIASP